MSHAWEETFQSVYDTGVPPPNNLKICCKVAGINIGKVYGLGSELNKEIGKSYHDCTWILCF